MTALDIIVPVYNEAEEQVKETMESAQKAFADVPEDLVNVIVVDDGSHDPLPDSLFSAPPKVRLVRHAQNRGYGAALKTGLRKGKADWIAIVDADGTYPVAELREMYNRMGGADMVVGVRTGDIRHIPPLRRLPKRSLNCFASYLTQRRIVDLNSGMRIFSRELAEYLWELFPAGFSFTSTLTMGAVLGGFEIAEHPIDYYSRKGTSSIQPISDTIRFFRIVTRLGLLFYPFKAFGPLAVILFLGGAAKGLGRDFLQLGYVGNMSVALMLAGVQVAMMGLLAELIVHSRKLRSRTEK